ncbi:hypothetical protein GJAV_G00268660 [Gymnothorax javanicus]|nr:hypothetical protein GJAV_G00268660 [Gymnothorax javanicus]
MLRIKFGMVCLLFSPENMMYIISKNNLKDGLLRSQHSILLPSHSFSDELETREIGDFPLRLGKTCRKRSKPESNAGHRDKDPALCGART